MIHSCQHFTFESCLDLSIGVKVTPIGNYNRYDISRYSQDLCSFMIWWSHFVLEDLNGFSGFHNINFEMVGFELI